MSTHEGQVIQPGLSHRSLWPPLSNRAHIYIESKSKLAHRDSRGRALFTENGMLGSGSGSVAHKGLPQTGTYTGSNSSQDIR